MKVTFRQGKATCRYRVSPIKKTDPATVKICRWTRLEALFIAIASSVVDFLFRLFRFRLLLLLAATSECYETSRDEGCQTNISYIAVHFLYRL